VALVAESFGLQRSLLPEPSRTEVKAVLVTFGGGDDRGAVERSLGWLDQAGFRGRRVILTGSTNPNLPRLRALAMASGEVELHEANWDPASLMAECQLAMCAGGTTLHELACLGEPTVMVTIAENQVAPARAWQEAGLGTVLGELGSVRDEVASALLKSCLADGERRLAMAKRAWDMQDGRGAERVARELVQAAISQPGMPSL
jgi:spore coat polysaccharide biosynthesis predicted glycosyltransferase SpsG